MNEYLCSVNSFTSKDGTVYYQFGYTDMNSCEMVFCDSAIYNEAVSILGNSTRPVPISVKWGRGLRGAAVPQAIKAAKE